MTVHCMLLIFAFFLYLPIGFIPWPYGMLHHHRLLYMENASKKSKNDSLLLLILLGGYCDLKLRESSSSGLFVRWVVAADIKSVHASGVCTRIRFKEAALCCTKPTFTTRSLVWSGGYNSDWLYK